MINVSNSNTNVPVLSESSLNAALLAPSLPESIYESKSKLHYFDYQGLKCLLKKHSTNFISIGVHNARSLICNVENYRELIGNSNLSVLAIVETWLKPSHTNKSVELEGYTLTRSDRNSKTKSRGGGVAFYLKKNVKFSVIAKSENDSEIDYLFIKLKHVHLVCGVVYKPPDVNDSKLEIVFKLLSEISSIEPNVMLMGDLNINLEAIKTSKTLNFFDY